MIEINIAKDYSKTPGGRHSKEGEYSGEDFREKWLIPKYDEAKMNGEKLRIVLDGGYGYGSSFLEEAFGGMARSISDLDLNIIEIVSDEEPQLIKDINRYIEDEVKKREKRNNEED